MNAHRSTLFLLAISAGLLASASNSRYATAAPADAGQPKAHMAEGGHEATDHEQDEDKEAGEKKDWKHEKHESWEDKEIEQSVPMNMVPQPVIDAVMKECPDCKISEAELEAKKDKIMWAFDVAVGDAKYDVKITVDGKFYSKKVDDEKDEKDEKDEDNRPKK